jgi:hypothetical protein
MTKRIEAEIIKQTLVSASEIKFLKMPFLQNESPLPFPLFSVIIV